MRHLPRIGVLCWLNQEYGRRVFIGAEAYAHSSRSLAVELLPAKHWDDKQLLRQINALDGLVSAVRQPEIAYLRRHIRVPTVEASLLPVNEAGIVAVSIDPAGAARVTVQHFASRRITRILLAHDGPAEDGTTLETHLQSAIQQVHEPVELMPCPSARDAGRMIADGPTAERKLPVGILCSRDGAASVSSYCGPAQDARSRKLRPVISI